MAVTLTSKAPGERLGYLWTPPLASGDTITGTPTVTRINGTASAVDVLRITPTQVKIFFISGSDGETAEFLCQVTTVGTDVLQETIYLPVNVTSYSTVATKLVQVFPAFAKVPPALIDYWLDEAAIIANWGNDHAQMLLACHYMSINGLGTDAAVSGVTKFKSGTVDMTFSEAKANAIGLNQTVYGQQFYILLRRRQAGPRIIAAGVA